MKTGCIKLFDKLIVVLLGATGLFAGCKIGEIDNPMDEYGVPPAEYGTPHALYEINGTVTDAATLEPVRNIRVVRPWYWDVAPPEFGDTTYTDEAGKYHFEFGDFPKPNKDYQLRFTDIDGEENGTYGFKTIEGEFTKQDQVEEGKGWYGGKFVKTQDVALDEPMVGPMYGVPSTPFQP
ncbi:hypothetical protein AGMMS49965_10210 [Bacteroidia bacterium]|nr:hypothetical protein AGMMS49965_10210 [Bacteroidia bacterium]